MKNDFIIGEHIKNYKNVSIEYRDNLIILIITKPFNRDISINYLKILLRKKLNYPIKLVNVFIHLETIEVVFKKNNKIYK